MVQTSKLREYHLGDRLHITAQQFWLILVGFVRWGSSTKKPLLYFGELAEKAGYADGRAGVFVHKQLEIITEFCDANELPNLSSIVTRRDAESVPTDEQQAVLEYNWHLRGVPTTGMLRKIWEKKT